MNKKWWRSAALCAITLFCAMPILAQRGGGNRGGADADQTGGGAQSGPKITDPKEADAFKAFLNAKGDDKKVSTGTQFLEKYPKSVAAAAVADQIVGLAYKKSDWPVFYTASNEALTINPDNAGVLALTGWVIARNYKNGQTSPTLDQAEAYDKHALELLTTMQKPQTLTDEQFAKLKETAASEAHSGLGLVYAREQKPQDAAAQLEQVREPDATDIFMLGASYEMMGKHVEAAQQFKKCSAMGGALQTPCTSNAASATKEGPDAAQ